MTEIEEAIQDAYKQRLKHICNQYFDASVFDEENAARLFRVGIEKAQHQKDRAMELIKT